METIERKSHGAILGSTFKDGVIYKGSIEEFQEWLEDLSLSLDGDIYFTAERTIPHGSGKAFEIYNDLDEKIYVWCESEYDGESEEDIYYFGEIV